jgi:MipA family protein
MARAFSTMTAACAIFAPTLAAAQTVPGDAPHGQVAIGAGVAPQYDGSDGLRVIPLAFGDIRWRGLTFELRGLRARVDFAADPRLSIGPVIGARLDRNDVDGPVGLLPTIGTAVEAGGYVGYRLGGDARGQGAVQLELSALHDVSGTHDGLLATASAGYAALRGDRVSLSFDIQTTWASADYTRTYFGISATDALASGLDPYRPGAGIRDVGAGLSAGYRLNSRLGLVGRAGASYLVGDTADSPITDLGSRWQPLAGLALSYRF